MSERIENIRKAVEKHAGCRAEHRESVPDTESYLDQIMWEGVVEVFDLDGHPKANRAYGWQFWEGRNAQYTAVLGISPVDSPNAAVRASIAAEAKKNAGQLVVMIGGRNENAYSCQFLYLWWSGLDFLGTPYPRTFLLAARFNTAPATSIG